MNAYRGSCERCAELQAKLDRINNVNPKTPLSKRMTDSLRGLGTCARGIIVLSLGVFAFWALTSGAMKLGYFVGKSIFGLNMSTSWSEPPGRFDCWGLGVFLIGIWVLVPALGSWSKQWFPVKKG